MRASELEGKEVIDSVSGERLGVIQESELLLNLATGTVEELILIRRGRRKKEEPRQIPWRNIRKIGADLIIVESNVELIK